MKKITFLLLFCFCAVGFSQAQTVTESSGGATANYEFSYDDSRVISSDNQNGIARTADMITSSYSGKSSALITITHSATQTIEGQVACGTAGIQAENHYYRDFDLANDFGIAGDFNVVAAEFGVSSAQDPVDITINIWSSTGADFPNGTLVLEGTAAYTSTPADEGTVVNVPVTATIPAGAVMVYEFIQADGSFWRIGSNEEGQTGVSWISADACGITTPTDLADVGAAFVDFSSVMNVIGDDGALALPITFEGAQSVDFNDFNGSATQVISNPDASGVNTSDNVAENFVPASVSFAGANIAVPVDLTDDKYFTMDVWSPLAGTPVLLKLEGGSSAPVERQATMTSTGAWEQVVFDFSSEGAVTYESVTIFMNFNVVDAADQTFYWDSLEQLNVPPAPPLTCGSSLDSYVNMMPTGNGVPSQTFSAANAAFDSVAADDFVIPGVGLASVCEVTIIGSYTAAGLPADPANTVVLNIHEDNGGEPGTVVFTESFLGTDVDPDGDATFTLALTGAPEFVGGTKYWMSVVTQMGFAVSGQFFWSSAEDGNGDAFLWQNPGDGFGSGCTAWETSAVCGVGNGDGPDLLMDISFLEIAIPPAELPLTFEGQGIVFIDFNGSATQAITNPDASGVNTTATVAENLIPASAEFAGATIVVPVDLTDDKFFIMDVWSPVADTPVLVKFEGGPDPAVERQVVMTSTGAWEELLFDFSSEGAVSYESVTVFMNFDAVDAADQTYYWDNLEQLNAPPPPPPPANDLCENALTVSCGDIVNGTTSNATEDSAVAPECDTTVTAPGVWYTFSDTSGLLSDISITTCSANTDYDTKISVYSGDCGALVCVVGNDDDPDCTGFQSTASFQSDGATTYSILVHGFGAGEGNFEMAITCTLVPPANDNIANSIDVDELGFPFTDPAVATIAATFEAGSPAGCDNAGARGVWYNFVAAGDGTATATITSPGVVGSANISAGLVNTNVSMGLEASGELSFTVNNGPLAGNYDALAAAFGGEFTTDPITGDIVLMIDDDTTGDPNDVCDPLTNGSELTGNIAVARRGACAFTDKVIAAQNEGAIAVIVINNQPGGPIVMGGENPDITIPALMIGDEDGEALLASLGGLSFTVNNGPLAGSYEALAAAFGGEFTADLVTGDTVLMVDNDTTGDPNDACDPLANGASLAGQVAIARRGACAFTDKVISAQNEGAIAVIVINNQPGGPIVMGGENPDITIPALMIGDEDGEALLASLFGFNAVTFYTAPNETASETDLELVDWFDNQCLPGTSASIPTVAGQAYYVFVANHAGTTDIVIDGTNLGVEDSTIEGFVYYPNPTESALNLRAQDNIERVAIYNMLGQKVLDQNVNAITSQLDLSDLATGTYILQVSVNGQIGNYQILKK
jgi:hypothetical protein